MIQKLFDITLKIRRKNALQWTNDTEQEDIIIYRTETIQFQYVKTILSAKEYFNVLDMAFVPILAV